jgi:hypothetical protein
VRRRLGRWLCLTISLGGAARAQPASDACRIPQPRVTWPLDLAQGGARAGGVTLYAASARLQPTLGVGCDRALALGPVGALDVVGSAGRLLGGAGVSVRLARPEVLGLVSVPIFLSAEALWGRGRRVVGGALTADAVRALRVTLGAGRDLQAHTTRVTLGLGTDLRRWIGPRPSVRVPEARAGEFDDLDPLPRRAAVRMSVRASWLLDPGEGPALDSARAVVDAAEGAPNTSALRAIVAARGPRRLAASIEQALREAEAGARAEGVPVPPLDDPVVQRKLVAAIVRGWRVAMRPT